MGAGSRALFLAGVGLVLAVNAFFLAAAAWNRRGEPEAELRLTERELSLPSFAQEENTGLALSLRLTHEIPGVVRRAANRERFELPPVEYDCLDRAKLEELGFFLPLEADAPEAAEFYRRDRMRRSWVVLELDGEAWRRWIAGREAEVARLADEAGDGALESSELGRARALLELDRTMRSRLFPVDAGLDPTVLRARYRDRERYALVEAMVVPRLVEDGDGEARIRGKVQGLLVQQVSVPAKLRGPLVPFLPTESWRETHERERRETDGGWPSPAPPRYRAVVAFGRRHEPWLESLAPTGPVTE